MPLGSFAHDALVDLDTEGLDRLLGLDETLFVEHKSSIGKDTATQIVKAVASFANTAGGWLLIGVRDGRPIGSEDGWAQDDSPPLVDVLRDRLRGEIDPLPTFEARVLGHPQGPVGVVRVYESSDTPHVAIRTGAVYVREVAGVSNAADPGKPGAGRHGHRVYEAAQIRSRAQLVELSARGRAAAERVEALVDPRSPLPLVSGGLPLNFERVDGGIQPVFSEQPAIVVRLAPYSLAPRFRDWATTSHAAAGVLGAAEMLANRHGLDNNWATPDPAGVYVQIEVGQGAYLAGPNDLGGVAYVVLDGAGVSGAALGLRAAKEGWEEWIALDRLAEKFIEPVALSAAEVLVRGEFLGRARCQFDLLRMPRSFLLEGQGNEKARSWVPVSGELTLPPEPDQVRALAQRAANALGRSAGVRAWD